MATITVVIMVVITMMKKVNKPNSYERRMRDVTYEGEELGQIFIAS